MRILLLACVSFSLVAQRTASVCGAEGNANVCTAIETSRIGALRFEDYRVTNANAPLVNLDVRRAHLAQIPLVNRNPLCIANSDAAGILSAPTVRFGAVAAQVSEVESVVAGQLNQEVYAQTTVQNLMLSDGLNLPQFVFRLSRSRGSDRLVLTLNPAYLPSGVTIADYTSVHQLGVDLNTRAVSFITPKPGSAQVLRLYWAIAANLPLMLNDRADIRVADPTPFGRVLFTPGEVREYAAAISRGVLHYASPTYEPVLDASCVKGQFQACAAQDALQTFGDALARNGSEYLTTGSLTSARVIGSNLSAWAAAGALAESTPRNLMSVLKPMSLFWPVMEKEPSIEDIERSRITNWLRPLYQTLAGTMSIADWRGTEAASIRMMDAIARRDDGVFRLAVERYFVALHQMRADGSLPMEAQRGACALSYTNLAVNSMVTLAEAAAVQGFDLYSLKVDGKGLDKAIEFLLDAYDTPALISKYNRAGTECELLSNAPMERKAFELAAGASAPAAWVEIYLSRFPESALAARLRTKLGLSGYAQRPLSHYSAAANTSCLFLTPQELTPLSLPLFDAFAGNAQTGATRSVLPERLAARVRSAAGVALPNVLVKFVVSSGTGTLEATSVLTDPFGVAATRLTLGARSGVVRVTASAPGALPVVFTATARGEDPKLTPGGVAGVGGSIPSVKSASPGAILSIYGADFVPPGVGRRATLQGGRLPTVLEGVCVYFGTVPAFMLDAYPTQLNVVVPNLTGTTAELRVAKSCGSPLEERTDPETVALTQTAPEFFFFETTQTGVNAVAAVDAVTGDYFGPLTLFEGRAKPVRPGEYVTLYLTGLGATTPAVAPGSIATEAATVRGTLELKLAGQVIPASNILYAGFSPGSLIYQINFRLPAGLPASNQPISVTVDGVTTPVGAYLTLALR
jgi:uncharacterized protein (TIGR03437 family)